MSLAKAQRRKEYPEYLGWKCLHGNRRALSEESGGRFANRKTMPPALPYGLQIRQAVQAFSRDNGGFCYENFATLRLERCLRAGERARENMYEAAT